MIVKGWSGNMSDFNTDRAQVQALGAFLSAQECNGTGSKPKGPENGKKDQQNQGVTEVEVQLELDLRAPKQPKLEG